VESLPLSIPPKYGLLSVFLSEAYYNHPEK
jgi:hypothetical protein